MAKHTNPPPPPPPTPTPWLIPGKCPSATGSRGLLRSASSTSLSTVAWREITSAGSSCETPTTWGSVPSGSVTVVPARVPPLATAREPAPRPLPLVAARALALVVALVVAEYYLSSFLWGVPFSVRTQQQASSYPFFLTRSHFDCTDPAQPTHAR